jgi:hypothetical protein
MLTITFSQCTKLELDEQSKQALLMPIIPRLRFYEGILLTYKNGEFTTLDEHFLLVAQSLRRRGALNELRFVSVCNCNDYTKQKKLYITVDQEGDMIDDCHHGFFSQRLKLLR